MVYKIINVGCDDETEREFEFTEAEYRFLESVFEALNEKSTYGCMPTIYIEKVGE